MDSLEKLSEIMGVVKGKKDGILSAMNQQVLELRELEGYFEEVQEVIKACFTAIESKELHLKLVQESANREMGSKRQESVRGIKDESTEAEVDSRVKELEARENEVDAMDRFLEERQTAMFSEEAKMKSKEKAVVRRENQVDSKLQMVEMRSSDLDLKERFLVKREKVMHSEAERLCMKETELHLKERKLAVFAEELQAKERTLNMKMKLIAGESSRPEFVQEATSESPAKMRGIVRKRSMHSILESCGNHDDDGIEIVDSSIQDVKRGCFRPERRIQPYGLENPGIMKNMVENQPRNQDGLMFVVTIAQHHELRSHLTVPSSFVAVYDLRKKESVILISDEGSFCLRVKHHEDPRLIKSRHVTFGHGWRGFYSRNKLRIGMVCMFRIKEHEVDGDASMFSMNVSILGG